MIPDVGVDPERHGYVLLSFIHVERKWKNENLLLNKEHLDLCKKFYVNQVKQKQGIYHYGTSGTIFGLGYGPKFYQNVLGHSVDRYSNSEFTYHFVIIYSNIKIWILYSNNSYVPFFRN